MVKVDDWRKEYAEILGDELVAKHSDVLNQVVPQSAIFLTALVFDHAGLLKMFCGRSARARAYCVNF